MSFYGSNIPSTFGLEVVKTAAGSPEYNEQFRWIPIRKEILTSSARYN